VSNYIEVTKLITSKVSKALRAGRLRRPCFGRYSKFDYEKAFKKNLLSVGLGPLLLVPALTVFGLFVAILETSALLEVNLDCIDTIILFMMMGGTGLIFAYGATIVFGLPTILLLQGFKKFSLPVLIVISVIPATVFFWFQPGFDWESWLFYSYSSSAVATGCWLVHRCV